MARLVSLALLLALPAYARGAVGPPRLIHSELRGPTLSFTQAGFTVSLTPTFTARSPAELGAIIPHPRHPQEPDWTQGSGLLALGVGAAVVVVTLMLAVAYAIALAVG